jgi:hypothetical protein
MDEAKAQVVHSPDRAQGVEDRRQAGSRSDISADRDNTPYLQPATCNLQPATCNLQPATILPCPENRVKYPRGARENEQLIINNEQWFYCEFSSYFQVDFLYLLKPSQLFIINYSLLIVSEFFSLTAVKEYMFMRHKILQIL